MQVFKNTYRKLDRDSAKNKVDNLSMYDCRNMSLMGDGENESGALVNSVGNQQIISALPGYSSDVIIGSKEIRDYTILFSTDVGNYSSTPTNTYGRIWKVDFRQTVPTFQLLYSGILNFSTYYPITEIESRYEKSSIQKVYWTDNYNNLRCANIATYLTSNSLVYNGVNSYIDPDNFNIINDVSFVTPVLSGLTSGNLPVGTVQYSYRLYKKHGSQTAFAPASQLIHLTDKSEGSISNAYRGADRNDSSGNALSSGKGIEMTITGVDTSFDKIEIIAIHYAAINETPTINVVDIYDIVPTLKFIDDGVYGKGSYTLTEFTLLNIPFKAKTLATKNNILFAGNISQEEFDTVYDARAYRWTSNSQSRLCRLYDKNGNFYWNMAGSLLPDIWAGSGLSLLNSWSEIPENFDCINTANNFFTNPYNTDSSSTHYKYKRNGSTLGGEGPNVSYEFTNDDFTLDTGLENRTIITSSRVSPEYYDGYASPLNSGSFRSHARNEVYRYGVVLFSIKGEPSPVHWIGDIRMPNHNEGNAFTYNPTAAVTKATPLFIRFTFNNIPTNISGYQIVRVKREKKDRSIIFQGKMSFMAPVSGEIGNNYNYCADGDFTTIGNYQSLTTTNKQHLVLFSPEISFNKDFVQGPNDYIEILGYFRKSNRYSTSDAHFRTYKYNDFFAVTPNSSINKIIDTAILLNSPETPDSELESFGLNSFNYRKGMFYPASLIGDLGTSVLAKINSAFTFTTSYNAYWALVNYRRPVTQYGGNNYEDRLNNEYIKASAFIPRTASTIVTDGTYGDVFIGFADIRTGYFNEYYNDRNIDGVMEWKTGGTVEMFPCESYINHSLRHDDCYHRIYSATPECRYVRDKGNLSFTAGSTTYSPGWTDNNLYNSIYSKEADAQKYYSKPYDYDTEVHNDVLVLASNVKINNEEIDSWTQFISNEQIEVNGDKGKLNYLRAWRNQLFYWQDDAIGILSVLDRSAVSDNSGQPLTIAEGGILSRFDEIATENGCSTRSSLITTTNGAYWWDNKRMQFNRFRESIEDIGIVKGMNSYFKSIPTVCGTSDNIHLAGYMTYAAGFQLVNNPSLKEIWFSIKKSFNNGETLVYNVLQDSFTKFIDHNLQVGFITQGINLISQTGTGRLYRENVGNRGYINGVYKASYVEVIVNPNPNIVSTFDAFEITTELYDSSDVAIHDESMTSIQVRNDYQDTGVVVFDSTNLKRLLRTWRINSLRDNVSNSPRLRDTYAKVKLSFTNTSANRKIILHDLISLYTTASVSISNKSQGNG